MNKRTIRLAVFHCVIVLLFAGVMLKYPEEIVKLKRQMHAGVVNKENQYLSIDECIAEFEGRQLTSSAGEKWYSNSRLVYHAAGGIDGLSYSNSREAMDQCIQNGNAVIEIDFLFTSDGELVCLHGWTDVGGLETACTLDEFKNLKIYGKYTPMTAEDVLDYMTQNPEIYIVVDTKDYLIRVIQTLVELCGERKDIIDRFVIQLYDGGEKQAINELYPFDDDNFLFSLYKFDEYQYGEILQICYEENIHVITVEYNLWDQHTKEALRNKGFIIFEHTVNRMDQAKDALEKGAYGIYTDFLTEEDINLIMK